MMREKSSTCIAQIRNAFSAFFGNKDISQDIARGSPETDHIDMKILPLPRLDELTKAYVGEEIIVVIPWDEWWQLSLKDSSNPQIALYPLHPDLRAKFNSTAAWEYAHSMMGKPCGYHNMIFSWTDTIGDNDPPPLDAHLVVYAMSMWTRVQPAYETNMWNEALNKRLGTEGMELHEMLIET